MIIIVDVPNDRKDLVNKIYEGNKMIDYMLRVCPFVNVFYIVGYLPSPPCGEV